jgi:ring-1,2-phenylacetyl-CoA epoxidase subunit PaaD
MKLKSEPSPLLPPSPGGGGSTRAARRGGVTCANNITPPRSPSASDPPPLGEGGDSLRERAWDAAASVVDPEIPVLTIADLGVLRAVSIENGQVEAVITPTYSGCPAMNVIEMDIKLALEKAGFANPKVTTVRSPAWTTDWMSEEGRAKLADYGIAPPARAGGRRALFGADSVTCPHCGSAETARISEFGSTACKALYRCRACAEPFDYFKCI